MLRHIRLLPDLLKPSLRRSSIGPILGIISAAIITSFSVGLTAESWPSITARIVGLAIVLIIISVPRQQFARLFARHFGWLPVVIGAATLPYWYWYAGSYGPPDGEFFATIAVILPVILLAAIIDVRRSRSLNTYQLVCLFW
jgi:hypothetical protein